MRVQVEMDNGVMFQGEFERFQIGNDGTWIGLTNCEDEEGSLMSEAFRNEQEMNELVMSQEAHDQLSATTQEYDVIRDAILDNVIDEVQDRLNKGWQLVGGIHADNVTWAQAITRYK